MSRDQWIWRAAAVVVGLLVVQLLAQWWGLAKYHLAAKQARRAAARVERIEYGYDSSMGASVRVATLHFFLMEQPQRPQNTISFSCPNRCAVDALHEQLQTSPLDRLVNQDRQAYVFDDGEVHLHRLSAKEIWQLAGLALLFKVGQVFAVAVIVHLSKRSGGRPLQ